MDNKELVVFAKDPYDKRGFKVWQIHGKFKYKNVHLNLCDTPSGCGPVQMYQYTSAYHLNANGELIIEFEELLNIILEDMLLAEFGGEYSNSKWFNRMSTSISFVQGYEGSVEEMEETPFMQMLKRVGFEFKHYTNIAHGVETDDQQVHCFLNIVKKYEY